MRRSDREVKNRDEILEIIKKCDVCRLSLCQDNVPYIVPMNFGYEYESECLTLYFHGASEGKKHDIMKQNPIVCFEMDCSHRLVEAAEPQKFTMEYESVIGMGRIVICNEKQDKLRALNSIMGKYAHGRNFDFPDQILNAVHVFKIEATDFTAKRLMMK